MILVDGDRYGEDDLMAAIDAGAEDVAADGDVLKVTTAAGDLAGALGNRGVGGRDRVRRASMEPTSTVEVGSRRHRPCFADGRPRGVRRRGPVHANFDVPEEILERSRQS